MKENGGLWGAGYFVVKTIVPSDLEWLDNILPTSKSFKKLEMEDPAADHKVAWQFFERGKMYIKLHYDMV